MNYYDTIPALVIDTVRSLYRGQYVELKFAAVQKFTSAIEADSLTAAISLILSQAALVVCIALAAFIMFIGVQRRMLKVQAEEQAASPAGTGQPTAVPVGALRDRWNAILAHLDSARESDWKLAVIEADTLVDDALARAGYAGATFGDRLSNIQPGMLNSLDGIWWAHKVRNRLAHEVDYFLRYTEARQALGYFEAALSELQLI